MEDIEKIKGVILREKKTAGELNSLFNYLKNTNDEQEKRMVNNQMEKLKISLKQINNELLKILEGMDVSRPLAEITKKSNGIPKKPEPLIPPRPAKKKNIFDSLSLGNAFGNKRMEGISEIDRGILKRLKKKKQVIAVKKEKKPSPYVQLANSIFANFVKTNIPEKMTKKLESDLIKSNLEYTSTSYLSILVLTTLIAIAAGFFLFIFFLFFDLGPALPIISLATEGFLSRLVKVIWFIFLIPIGTFSFMYTYPSLEKGNLEGKINQELPFATIHMAAIAGSMIEPTKVFSIVASTKEYPSLEGQLNKLMNEINVYGYDLVTALKDSALNCPSLKLAELFNGLATTITSGGNLYDFFDKRAQNMLFEYRLDKEKNTKAAETSMDIYISVVIAAPMILMLLLMMMKISGLGVALSTSTITLMVVGGVSLINVVFLIFLQIKQPRVT